MATDDDAKCMRVTLIARHVVLDADADTADPVCTPNLLSFVASPASLPTLSLCFFR